MTERNSWNYRNPCLTMHQPWASLLVYGIKRIEGRSWPAPIRGRLWIHAASKVPDEATVKAMEEFYREIYAVDGIYDLKFPENYPVSRLLGCVQVVGCSKREELACWKEVSEGVRLEALTDFCWLCEQPQKLSVPFEMRGNQGVYNLERKIYEAAVRGLAPVESPLPIKFPLPNPRNPFSLKPGSIFARFPESKATEMEKSSTLISAIAGAQAAATQFSKKDQSSHNDAIQNRNIINANRIGQFESKSWENNKSPAGNFNKGSNRGTQLFVKQGQSSYSEHDGRISSHNQLPRAGSNQHLRPPSKIFTDAMRELRLS